MCWISGKVLKGVSKLFGGYSSVQFSLFLKLFSFEYDEVKESHFIFRNFTREFEGGV